MLFEYEPGNGTRYHLFLTQGDGRTLIVWLKNNGRGGPSFLAEEGDFIHWTYFMEKTGINSFSDAAALLGLLSTRGHTVGLPAGYNERGHYTGG